MDTLDLIWTSFHPTSYTVIINDPNQETFDNNEKQLVTWPLRHSPGSYTIASFSERGYRDLHCSQIEAEDSACLSHTEA